MCKAIDYASKLISILNEVENKRNSLRELLSDLDLAQQDLLHKAENENFNIVQGYDIAKGLKDIRQARRKAKNELTVIEDLVVTTNGMRTPIIKTKDKIGDKYIKLSVAVDQKRYNSKKINIDNDIRKEIKILLNVEV